MAPTKCLIIETTTSQSRFVFYKSSKIIHFLKMQFIRVFSIAATALLTVFVFSLSVQADQADVLKTGCEEFSGFFKVNTKVLENYIPSDIKVTDTIGEALIRFYVMSNCESVSLNGEDINTPSRDFGLATLAVDTQAPTGPGRSAKIDGAEFNMAVRYNYTLWTWVSGTKRDKLISALKKANIPTIPAKAIEIDRFDSLVEGRLVELDNKAVTWKEKLVNPSYGRLIVGVQIDFLQGEHQTLVECLWPVDKDGTFSLETEESRIADVFGKRIKGSIAGHTFKNDCTITYGIK